MNKSLDDMCRLEALRIRHVDHQYVVARRQMRDAADWSMICSGWPVTSANFAATKELVETPND